MNTIKKVTTIGAYSLLIFCLLFTSCESGKNIGAVRVHYLPKDLHVITAIDEYPKMLEYSELIKDTLIKDNSFLNEFSLKVKNLKPASNKHHCDIRINCVFKHNGDDSLHHLSLGESGCTLLDGQLMQDDPELIKMIKDIVYK